MVEDDDVTASFLMTYHTNKLQTYSCLILITFLIVWKRSNCKIVLFFFLHYGIFDNVCNGNVATAVILPVRIEHVYWDHGVHHFSLTLPSRFIIINRINQR